MNSEEMKLLQNIAADMQGLKSDVAELKSDMQEVKKDVAELKSDVAVLKSDVAELKSDVAVLKSDVAELKSDVAVLKSDVANIDRRLTRVELVMENEISRSIRFIAEAHTGLFDKVSAMHDDVERIKDAVSILDFVQKQMAKSINK